ncbi:ABC transporter permease [Porphyromonas cangingivalis]|uniref:Putative ABC transport system permease protein n=1 Tax=Porphyromonas cangingivalis TaxID=36874 RepID=A0A1T4K1I4_PORCN|nr:FtsX-like permease family protein [Porphyromonas cangingivalis]SJZ36332.1 putative ABC transport system permease protein [Porphyromonas cangingivalis]VEJ03355.1 Macrolide export ATP-binding/permease protein MacB [Porphyromonas cangingivalis]
MIKHIFTILWNERKQNIALWLELMIVSAFLWYIGDTVYYTVKNYLKPLGFDVEHTYEMRLGLLTADHKAYIPDLSVDEQIGYLATILERVQNNPMIEAASYSFMARPYNRENSSIVCCRDTLRTQGSVLFRRSTPDFFKVFKYKAERGSTEELVQVSESGELVVSTAVRDDLFPDGEDCIGKKIYLNDEDSVGYRVGAVSQDVRYGDYHKWSDYINYPMTSNSYKGFVSVPEWLELCVRVKPEQDRDFVTRFRKEMSQQLRLGNYYLNTIDYMPEVRDAFQKSSENELKEKLFVILFLLINIFLGVTGVFWFRTQQRKTEIGLRIALGDMPNKVLGKFFIEGVMILLLALVPVMILFVFLFQQEVLESYFMDLDVQRYFAGLGITFILLLIMILFGVWFPARRAVNVSPAETLRDE